MSFLRSNGLVAASEFRMSEKDAHICISITCIRYIMLCASTIAERLPNVKSRTSQNLKECAQYLEEMAFATYAFRYLEDHTYYRQEDAYVIDMTSKLIDEFSNGPAADLFQIWLYTNFRKPFSGDDFSQPGMSFPTGLLYASVREGYPIASEVSLIIGAHIDVKDEKAATPLHYAAENGYEAVARLLLDYGADHLSKDNFGWTPISLAATRGHEAVVRLLLERGADSESKEYKYGQTPLSLAAANGHEGVVRVLLEGGADSESKDKYGQSPLSWAAEKGHEAVVKVLLDNRVDIESIDYEYGGRTPLSWAAANGHDAVVRLLLDKGANIKSKDDSGQSNDGDVVIVLLESGADVEPKWYKCGGRTPLSWAAEYGHEVVVGLLLSKGAGVEIRENDYGVETPLSWAEENGHEAVVKLLRATLA